MKKAVLGRDRQRFHSVTGSMSRRRAGRIIAASRGGRMREVLTRAAHVCERAPCSRSRRQASSGIPPRSSSRSPRSPHRHQCEIPSAGRSQRSQRRCRRGSRSGRPGHPPGSPFRPCPRCPASAAAGRPSRRPAPPPLQHHHWLLRAPE